MITPEQLSTIAGVVISLLAFYLPRVGPWYNALPGQSKAQVMGAVIVAVGLVSFALAYFNIGPFTLGVNVPIGQTLWQLVLTIFAALISNQSTFLLMNKLQPPFALPAGRDTVSASDVARANVHGAFEVADPIQEYSDQLTDPRGYISGETRART